MFLSEQRRQQKILFLLPYNNDRRGEGEIYVKNF